MRSEPLRRRKRAPLTQACAPSCLSPSGIDRLRSWRNSRAVAEGIPPYVLLTNRKLAEVARRRPTTLTALREVGGIGEAKAGRFGADLLAVVVAAVERPELGRAATGAAHAA